ncbi:MAG TPA: hypothetical protein VMS60_07305 [Solirubrobacterales bacterium]|nr:hypothetical protein [Solirubrobacterales bacterium]
MQCSPATPGQFFDQAAGHPQVGFTQYTVKQEDIGGGKSIPVGAVATIQVDLPPGLTVNPLATPVQCTLEEFDEVKPADPSEGPNCPAASAVGEEQVTLKVIAGPGAGTEVAPIPGVTKVPVYNLVPKDGEPALFGFKAGAPGAKEEVFLTTSVAWESDFHESFTIAIPPPSAGTLTYKSRLVNFGRSGDGTYITNPTTCFSPLDEPHLYSTWLRSDSVTEVGNGEADGFPGTFTPFEAALPPGPPQVEQEGCENVLFEPEIEVAPGTNSVDSPAAATVTTTLPFDPATEGAAGVSQSHLRSAKVTLPNGMGLNPAGSVGLVACTDADFKKGQRVVNNSCPAASKIGTVEIDTPPLPDGSLKGDIYVGEQKSSNPASGEEFRTLVEAKSERFGVVVRLIGNVAADPITGQLTATFDEQAVGPFAGPLPKGLPQVPFKAVKLHFDGAKAVLSSPPTCSASQTNGAMEPWSRPGTTTPVTDQFTLSSVPGGGTCPTTLAERKFAPAYTANSDNATGGAYSPFRVHIGRPDGQQEVKGVTVTLPKGLTGKLAGIPYCPEAALAAAAASTNGKAELASPSCSAASQIGTATTESGTGPAPLKLGGKAYLAGPYKGAPVSMAIITPAISGPFDLGVVVVRVALNVNPETAAITAVSDVIPDVFGGVKLDLRAIDVNVDRSQFMLNPTNCAAQATAGTLAGGGSDPANPGAFSSYAFSTPYQAVNCNKLGFKPKFRTKLFGPTKRAKNPRLRAILEARKGDANLARTALTLPHSLFLDQSHIGTVCTRPQLASQTCPAKSVYGNAEATTPLLDNKLKGKVYLVSSNNKLPDLLVDLRGQVNVQLRGVISSKRGGLKTVFNGVPDVPVKKFILNMKGGKKSLLVNSTNTCKAPQLAVLKMKAQNGKTANNNKFKLNIANCAKKKGKGGKK